MNMANKYTYSWQSAAGAAEECQYLNQLLIIRKGGTKWMEICVNKVWGRGSDA